uniref:Uncharacterized protein n=1 Tax=Anguilla anguilla TaxID=7936 RepID=A0A0E9WCX4_ANGAN
MQKETAEQQLTPVSHPCTSFSTAENVGDSVQKNSCFCGTVKHVHVDSIKLKLIVILSRIHLLISIQMP